mgnify:CR=1 FL=1
MVQQGVNPALTKLCDENEIVYSICALFGTRQRRREVLLRVILDALQAEADASGISAPSRPEVIKALREIEATGEDERFGRYIEGRHGHESRFRITEELISFGKELAAPEISPNWEDNESETAIDATRSKDIFDEIVVPLREGISAKFVLPKDLTEKEAAKLAGIMQHLFK